MYNIGIVQSIDYEKLLVKVKFNLKDVVSYNMRLLQQFTGKNKTFWLPDINEMVVCILDEARQTGIILGSIYSADKSTKKNNLPDDLKEDDIKNAVYYHSFQDGTNIKYDRVNKKLTINVKADINETIGDDGKKSDDKDSKGKVTRIYKKEINETYEDKITGSYKAEIENTYEKKVTATYKDEIINNYEKKQTGNYKDERSDIFEKLVTRVHKDDVKETIDKDLTVEIKGKATIKITGDANIEANNVVLKGNSIKINGGSVSINDCLEVAG